MFRAFTYNSLRMSTPASIYPWVTGRNHRLVFTSSRQGYDVSVRHTKFEEENR